MSLHRSFLAGRAGNRHRNVLSRHERLEKLAHDRGWKIEENSVFGLPKVGNRKVVGKSKKKEEKTDKPAAAAAAPEKTEKA